MQRRHMEARHGLANGPHRPIRGLTVLIHHGRRTPTCGLIGKPLIISLSHIFDAIIRATYAIINQAIN